MHKRRTLSPGFKAMVAREAISDGKMMQEIEAGHAIPESQWKEHHLDGANELVQTGLSTDIRFWSAGDTTTGPPRRR